MNTTYTKLSNMIYRLREQGAFPELESKETGKAWKDLHTPFIYELLTLRRLANKHRKLAEMDCNGVGVVRGRVYYSGMSYGETPDAYEVREYGYGVRSAYLDKDTEETIFDTESDKVRAKIEAVCARLGLRVEFQGDPRGYTVKVFKGDRFLDIQG
jgi:hypothetical protein